MKYHRDWLRPGYEFNSPTFILDENFQYADWNYAWDELFAKEYDLRLGMHGTYIDQFLVNCEELSERTAQVFSQGAHPLVDTEIVILKTQRYGVVHCQKLAAQIIDEKGHKVAWVVTCNILSADRLELLWSDLMKRFEKEVRWSSLVSLRESHLKRHSDYSRFQESLISWLSGPASTLLVGAPSPLFLPSGPRNAILEPNHQAWEMCRARLGVGHTLQVVKGRLELVKDFQGSEFERILVSDPGLRSENASQLIEAVAKLATPRTEVVVLSSDLEKEKSLLRSLMSGDALLAYEETLSRFTPVARHFQESGREEFFSGAVSIIRLRREVASASRRA